MSEVEARPQRPDSLELVTDLYTVAFGGWTVVSTLTTIFGGTPRGALSTGALLLIAGLAAIMWSAWQRLPWIEPYMRDASDRGSFVAAGLVGWQRMALVVAALVPVVAWFWLQSLWAVWYSLVAVSVVFTVVASWPRTAAAQSTAAEQANEPRWVPWLVHGLALACALFTLIAFRPRSDDAFYVNMAVTIADYPNLPLYSHDMIHGPETPELGPQVLFPPYRVHAFESLGGFIAYRSGLDAVAVLHLGLATFFGWLTPIAIGRALRLLAPRAWLLGLLATLSFYVIEGSASRGFSNQAFVRLFNGKSALLTVAVPLLIVYGLRFAQRPSWPRFALLVFAQNAALGLSSTGIWLAPALAGLAVVAGTPSWRKALWTLPLGGLSSLYVVAIGLWVRAQMGVGPVPVAALVTAGGGTGRAARNSGPDAGLGLIAWVTEPMLAHQPTIIASLLLFGLAAALTESRLVLKLFASLGLLTFALLGNPWLARLVATAITGKLTYERVYWLLPIPLALGIVCSALYGLLRARVPRVAAAALVIAAVAGVLFVATERLVISDENQSSLRFPPVLKDWPRTSKTARAICERTKKGESVLVSKTLAHSISNLHDCGHPVIAEMRWMQAPLSEERRRNALEAVVAGEPYEHDMAAFAEGLGRYKVVLVALKKPAWEQRATHSVLRRQGFERIDRVTDYQLWKREGAGRQARNDAIARAVCAAVKDPSEVVLAPFAISRAVARVGCGAVPLAAQGPLGRDELSIALFDFEDMLATRYAFAEDGKARIARLLEATAAAVVVVGPEGIRNRELKDQLAASGFDKQLVSTGHHIYRRQAAPPPAEPPAAGPPAAGPPTAVPPAAAVGAAVKP